MCCNFNSLNWNGSVVLNQEQLISDLADVVEPSSVFDSTVNSAYGALNSDCSELIEISPDEKTALIFKLEEQLAKLENDFDLAQKSNGWISGIWNLAKNCMGIGASSNKVKIQLANLKEQIEKFKNDELDLKTVYKNITGMDLSQDDLNSLLNGDEEMDLNSFLTAGQSLSAYSEGQKMCTDVVGDMISGIIAVGALAAAPLTGGTSIALAAAVGASVKIAIKASDCIGNEKTYRLKDFGYDLLTGSINGAMAPISNGLGGAAGTGVAKIFGLKAAESTVKEGLEQALKVAGKEVLEEVIEETGEAIVKSVAKETLEEGVEQTGKSILSKILAKQGVEYVLKEGAETTVKSTVGKIAAYSADMALDGSLSGAMDGFARAVAEGRWEDIPQEMLTGGTNGFFVSPIIGGGFRIAGKVGSTVINKVNNKITIGSLLPDGTLTKFSQGKIGDCALLSMLNGFLSNSKISKQIQNAITTTADGGYRVKIGSQIIKIAREELTGEMLSDTTGIRVFELAYKKVNGSLDGEFAERVAKFFGLNPVHITSDSITDEVLEAISKDSDNLILSLGARVDADGIITPDGEFLHYFSIKNVDLNTKTLTLVDTYDTSKTFKMLFEDIRTQGVSIDGGSIKKTNLPSFERNADEIGFRGFLDNDLNKLSIKEKQDILFGLGIYEAFFDEHHPYVMCDDDKFNAIVNLLKSGADKSSLISIADKYTAQQLNTAAKYMSLGVYFSNACSLSKRFPDFYDKAAYLIKEGAEPFMLETFLPLEGEEFDIALKLLKNNVSGVNFSMLFKDEEMIKFLTFLFGDGFSKFLKNTLSKVGQNYFERDNIKAILVEIVDENKLSLDELKILIQKFSKSTLKNAMKRPNEYLSDIDLIYTTKINGKYPELPPEVLEAQQKQIIGFFDRHLLPIFKALKYLDVDTINQMMSKRTSAFSEALEELYLIENSNFKLLSRLISCVSECSADGRLSANDKVQLCSIVKLLQDAEIDMEFLEEIADSGVINVKTLKKTLCLEVLEGLDIDFDETAEALQSEFPFNSDYFYLLLNSDTKSVYNNATGDILNIEPANLYELIKVALTGDFSQYILDEGNKFGRANALTRKLFKKKGLNYDFWLTPEIDDLGFTVGNKQMTIKMWDRNPFEDLFIGNKTSCCTAIVTGCNGNATPSYLMNTAFNVVELIDDLGNVIGMSRIFMAEIDGKPSVVMDNIELNAAYKEARTTEAEKIKIRNAFFEYINKFAQGVTGDDNTQVYFSMSYLNVPSDDLHMVSLPADFIGGFSDEAIYINAGRLQWVDPQTIIDTGEIPWYLVPEII